MSKGWVIGTAGFARAMVGEYAASLGQGRRLAGEMMVAQELVWQDMLQKLLRRLGRRAEDLKESGKSADWKLAMAAVLKARTTATNRWLGTTLHLGNRHEVSRKVAAWMRRPDAALTNRLAEPQTPKPDPI